MVNYINAIRSSSVALIAIHNKHLLILMVVSNSMGVSMSIFYWLFLARECGDIGGGIDSYIVLFNMGKGS